eukprot:5463010-Amphidinium_carterae.1
MSKTGSGHWRMFCLGPQGVVLLLDEAPSRCMHVEMLPLHTNPCPVLPKTQMLELPLEQQNFKRTKTTQCRRARRNRR